LPSERIWSADFTAAFAANFFFSLGFWSFVHLPGFLQGLGGREAEIGIVIGSLSISAILIRPWLGRVMDRRGRRPVVVIGGIVNVVAVSLYLTVDSLGPWIYVVRILHGLSEAAIFSVIFTIAADLVPASRRTEGIAMFGVSGLLPLSLGGLLGDWILGHWDYTTLFAASAFVALLALLVSLPIKESRPKRDESKPQTALMEIFFDQALIPLWVLTLGFVFGLTSYFTFIKTYIGETETGSVGLFFLAYSIASVGLRLLFSWLPDRIGPKRALVPAIAAMVAGILVLANADTAAAVALAGTLCGLGHAFVFPILSALVVNRAHADNRGVAMTLFTSIFDVGALAGAPALGWVIEGSSYGTMFTVAAATVCAFSLAFFLMDRTSTPAHRPLPSRPT
jgi:predicted MFS family arabinose efflux permease